MEYVNRLFWIVATSDPGLIGEHNEQVSLLFEEAKRLASAGNPSSILRFMCIAGVVVKSAVAVEEEGFHGVKVWDAKEAEGPEGNEGSC